MTDEEQRDQQYIQAMNAAVADAKARGFGKGNPGDGSVPCPACQGTLSYSVAGSNGHIWGKCSTAGCIRWLM